LKVTTERLPDCKVKLTVEVEPTQVQKPLRETARELARQYRIPGFRPGKAPLSVVVRRFGQETLLKEVVESEGQNWYEKALEEAELSPAGQAQLEVTSYEPLIMTFTLPVAPTVELGSYREIRVDWEPSPVSDEDVERELARQQQENATLEPKEGPAEMEDVATLDIQGRIGDEMAVVLEERAVTLHPNINYPVAGFAQQIVGMSPGQDREFTLVYPEDHANAAWAGQEAHFNVHMRGLKTRVTPALDDELARTVGDFASLDEWRASVRQELETQALEEAEQDYADRAVEAAVAQAHIEYPSVVVERELDSMMADLDRSLKQQGLGLENYLIVAGQSQEDYRQSLRETAERRVKRRLVLTELVEAEGLQVSAGELEAEIDRLAEPLGDEAENFRQMLGQAEVRESIRQGLLTQAATDRLKAIARGEGVPEAVPEPATEPTEAEPEVEPTKALQEATDANLEEEVTSEPLTKVELPGALEGVTKETVEEIGATAKAEAAGIASDKVAQADE